jgi:hypothetical protein
LDRVASKCTLQNGLPSVALCHPLPVNVSSVLMNVNLMYGKVICPGLNLNCHLYIEYIFYYNCYVTYLMNIVIFNDAYNNIFTKRDVTTLLIILFS